MELWVHNELLHFARKLLKTKLRWGYCLLHLSATSEIEFWLVPGIGHTSQFTFTEHSTPGDSSSLSLSFRWHRHKSYDNNRVYSVIKLQQMWVTSKETILKVVKLISWYNAFSRLPGLSQFSCPTIEGTFACIPETSPKTSGNPSKL